MDALTRLNTVEGNKIGTDLAGTGRIGNGLHGVLIDNSSNNTVGGATEAHGNVISANAYHGVAIEGTSAQENRVVGNKIGTDWSGVRELGNRHSGVNVSEAIKNHIGAVDSYRNIISGNTDYGVRISGGNENNVVKNHIGTNWAGTEAIANQLGGVSVRGVSNTIGGTAEAARNVISGNGTNRSTEYGVFFRGAGTTNNFLQGNYIGTKANGTDALGNASDGVYLEVGTNGNTIGGNALNAGNVICANGNNAEVTGFGVSVRSSNNTIRFNKIGKNVDGNVLANAAGWLEDTGTNTVADNDHN